MAGAAQHGAEEPEKKSIGCHSLPAFPRTAVAGVRSHGEKSAAKAVAKGKHAAQHAEDPAAEHDFLGCMSR